MTDKEEFDQDVSKISLLHYMIEKWFGERCSEYEETCECCRRWRFYDKLIENPFETDFWGRQFKEVEYGSKHGHERD